MKIYKNIFDQIVAPANLFQAWEEFKADKMKKADVLAFECHLEENIFDLYHDLKYHKYKHGVYTAFTITDPKIRKIHKAIVRDRILHHAIFRILYPAFEPSFISNSFSCRIGKGSHKGINALAKMLNTVSKNNRKDCFALKCDIKKFFDSINHQILLGIIKRKIKDPDLHWLIEEIVNSFGLETGPNIQQLDLFGAPTERERERERESTLTSLSIKEKGIPIGNLTSQLFANVYMNEFDQFVKHKLKVKHYCRYTDDFVVVADNRSYLEDLLPQIELYLGEELKLKLHPSKVSIRKYQQGIDFLGYVTLPHHTKLRTKTKRRIFSKLKGRVIEYKNGVISEETLKQSLNSYLGVLSHANAYRLQEELKNQYWYWLKE